jgi:hypothetical protein
VCHQRCWVRHRDEPRSRSTATIAGAGLGHLWADPGAHARSNGAGRRDRELSLADIERDAAAAISERNDENPSPATRHSDPDGDALGDAHNNSSSEGRPAVSEADRAIIESGRPGSDAERETGPVAPFDN